MYSKVVLIALFLIIVVLGVVLNKRPSIPDGYQDAGFCAKSMPQAFAGCQRFYFSLTNMGKLRGLSDGEKVAKIQQYVDADAALRKMDETYANKMPQEQYSDIERHINGGKEPAGGYFSMIGSLLSTASAPAAEKGAVAESRRMATELQGVCPTEAYYDADGKIHVEPSGLVFTNSTEYTNYLAKFYAKNNCKPIEPVRPYTGPQPGILGGLGNGTPSPLQVASERNDRTVVNQALVDLYDRAGSTQTHAPGQIPVHTFQFPAPGEQTYAKTQINSLDDYEFNRVFELENRPRMAPLSKEVKSNLLGAMQLDWPSLPYSSDTKAQLEEQFVDARMQDVYREPKSGVFFRNMEGVEVAPPDEDAAAAREAKILSAYQPTDITTHVVDDEYERVAKVVAQQYSTDPDWEPVVEKRGPHQYAVTELRPRRKTNKTGEEETVWEGDEATTVAQAKQQGLMEGGEVKPNSMTIQDNLQDPFFAKTGVADHSNDRFWRYSDFNKWSSNLERQFAPTDPTDQWK